MFENEDKRFEMLTTVLARTCPSKVIDDVEVLNVMLYCAGESSLIARLIEHINQNYRLTPEAERYIKKLMSR